jgi:Fis family transcriptional regulator, factor for inversion stimulation protein
MLNQRLKKWLHKMVEKSKLQLAVTESLEDYFTHLDGQPPHAIYDMVLSCVEKPMLEFILNKVGGNQSKAAEILGLNRNTLRKKMAQYNLN